MKIVVAGAGSIGYHLSKLLSSENQDITLIDINQEALDFAQLKLDVLTIKGDSSSIKILEDANVHKVDLFIAVTTSEDNNLMSCIMAKKLGAKQTIARVTNPEYIEPSQKQFFKELGIDHTISPRELAAQEIKRLLTISNVTDIFEFEGGKIIVLGIVIEETSTLNNLSINEIQAKYPDCSFKPLAILRGGLTLFPDNETKFLKKDHVYFITDKNEHNDIMKIVSTQKSKISNVMILGGSNVAARTAFLLEKEYKLTIVEQEKIQCINLAESLDRALIIKGDPSDINLLKEEGLEQMDAVLALSLNSETNIVTSLLAENYGVKKTIALVENPDYVNISHNIGVDTLINRKIIAANNIFRFVRKGKIEALCSLHGVNAEVIEYVVDKNNRITHKPLKDLFFPKGAIIGAVLRGDTVFHPNGDFFLSRNDKVIVFALNESIPSVEKFFK